MGVSPGLESSVIFATSTVNGMPALPSSSARRGEAEARIKLGTFIRAILPAAIFASYGCAESDRYQAGDTRPRSAARRRRMPPPGVGSEGEADNAASWEPRPHHASFRLGIFRTRNPGASRRPLLLHRRRTEAGAGPGIAILTRRRSWSDRDHGS